jgi:hypothetical protein
MHLQESAPSKYKRRPRSRIEYWARALGVSKERLLALVKEIVEERQALGT